MKHKTKNRIISKKGFTIIEALITMSLTLLIGTIVTKVLLTSTQSANTIFNKVSSQKAVRSALRFIAKDLTAAESITTPAIGNTDQSLVIQGLKLKKVTLTDNWTGSAGRYRVADNSLYIGPWVRGKPVVVYEEDVNGNPAPKKTGYKLDYAQGIVDFATAPTRAVTADFSTDQAITYSLVNERNPPQNNLYRGSLRVAENITNTDIFNRQSKSVFNIRLVSNDYDIVTTIDASSGTYIRDVASPTTSNLNSVSFVNENKGWVAGDNGALYEFDGGSQTWTNQSTGTDNLNSISFADSSTGLIAGENGTVLIYNDPNWSPSGSLSNNFFGTTINDNNNIDVVGQDINDVNKGFSYNFDGALWAETPSATSTNKLNDITQYLGKKYAFADTGMIYEEEMVTLPGSGGTPGDLLIDDDWSMSPGNYMADIEINNNKIYFDRGWADKMKEYDITATGGTYNSSTNNSWGPSGSAENSLEIDGGYIYSVRNGTVEKWNINTSATDPVTSASIPDSNNYGLGISAGYVYVQSYVFPYKTYRFDHDLIIKEPNPFIGDGTTWAVEVDEPNGLIYANNNAGIKKYNINTVDPVATLTGNYISNVRDMELDNNGYLWVAAGSTAESSIWRINVNASSISCSTGDDESCKKYVIPTGTFAQWAYPGGIALDSQGRVYVAASGSWGNSIKRWNQVGGTPPEPGGEELSWDPVAGAPFGASNINSATLAIKDNGTSDVWAVGDGGQIIRFNGSEWDDNISSPTAEKLNSVHFFDEETGWAVGDEGTVLRYDADLDQWFEIPSGTNVNLNSVFLYSKDEGYIVGYNGTVLKIGSVKS